MTEVAGALPFPRAVRDAVVVGEGATWLRGWLCVEQQQALMRQCRQFLDGPAGGYVPTVRGGGKMRVRMTCLGRHWNARTYAYESSRTDHDGAPVAPVPEPWVSLAASLAAAAGYVWRPDICLINAYDADGRMGLHQDKDESATSIASGAPIVSISLGDSARFLFGGLRRRDSVRTIVLESGDVFVFGGPARLRYHGVSRILPGTAPVELDGCGRINLTFRRY